MWKDSYKIGVSKIDEQHKELFRVTGNLLKTLNEKESEDTKKECIEAVSFLKNYAVEHFADEERYQAEINYSDIEAHKKIHKKFVNAVLEHEKKMVESDFSISTVKDFSGMLAAWLIYHVADEDQKISKGAEAVEADASRSVMEVFEDCVCDVLNKTAGMKDNEIKKVHLPEKGIKGEISFVQSFAGDIMGDVVFVFTKPLVLKLFEIMTTLKLMVMDDMVIASLSELMEIISEKAVVAFSKNGKDCSVVSSAMNTEETKYGADRTLGIYTLVGNMGIHDESVHD